MESESAPPNTTNTTTTATAVAVAAVAAEAEVVISSTSAVTDAPVVVVVAGSKRTHEELEAAVVVAVNEYSASSVSANVPQDSHPAAAVAPAAEDDSHSASAAKRQMIHDPNAQIFKIQLGNLSKYTDKKKLSKWCEAAFTEKGVSVPANMKVKTVPAWTHAILTFESHKDMESAAEAFKDRQFKSHQVSIECLVEQVGDNNNRRGLGEDPRGGNKSNNNRRNNNTSSSSFDASDNRTPQERLNDQVTPLWRKTYTEQLVEKTRTVKKTLKKFTRMLQDTVKGQSADKKAALDWLGPAERNGFFGLCEPAVVGSPRETGYRSKCEFSFGRNAAGEKTLGFLLGLFKDGITSVLDVDECLHVSPMSKKIVSVIQTHIRAHSKLDVYDRISKQGFWRLLLLRTQDTGDVMLYLQINTIDLDPTLVMAELDALMKCLHSERERGEICLTTVLVEDSQSWFNGIGSSAKATTTITAAANAGNEETSGIDVDELLGKKSVYKIELGEGYIQENLLGIKFQISPFAFFQVNTPVAELMFSTLKDWCQEYANESVQEKEEDAMKKETLLLDLCCGTGTIGQVISTAVDSVVGIDIVEQAIIDARRNAEINNITNVEYIAGKAEDAIKKTIRKYVYGMSEEEMEEEDNKRKMNNKRQAETATATAAAVATTTTMTNDSPITIDAGAGTNPDSVSTTIATTATPSSSVLTFKKPIRTTNKRVIAIMDPPRAGMHSSVIKAVRDCPAIETAIFVACDAEQSSSNWTELCRPRSNNYKGEPFQLVRVQGFDMFPQTKGFELVLEFRRGAALKAKSVMIATAAKLGSVEEEKKDVIEECL